MKNNVYISTELVKNINSEPVWGKLKDDFGFDYDIHDEFHNIHRSYGNADSEPIDIDTAIKTLSELKEMGSTHVQIDYHCDHGEYIFSGMKIQLADEKLISKYEKHMEKERSIDYKIALLNKEIRELEQERKIIED